MPAAPPLKDKGPPTGLVLASLKHGLHLCHAQSRKLLNVLLGDPGRVYVVRNRFGDTCFPQYVKHGLGRSVGVVPDVVFIRVSKAIARVKAGDLKFACEGKPGENIFAHSEKLIEGCEVRQHIRMYK